MRIPGKIRTGAPGKHSGTIWGSVAPAAENGAPIYLDNHSVVHSGALPPAFGYVLRAWDARKYAAVVQESSIVHGVVDFYILYT